ncbi:class I SAM-dependent methyltransferase [Nocardia otitidiscaviarum]|nr:class I SAM-dependent methyltransferase [Nocardia otitidiscaviarum]MBF6483237.1 class I SAM-dependent methyltransferase [Nocardia otitidiscaviarum]
MPRGGPDATWLDRVLQTNQLEFTDRSDVPESLRRMIVRSLIPLGDKFGTHEANARYVASLVENIAEPRILELGAGHGQLSTRVLNLHPGARVTATDIDAGLVADMAAGALGTHPRASVRIMDATEIDAPEGSFDLVVFAAGFHHLSPGPASRSIAEGTRVGARFLVVDGIRPPAGKLLLRYATLPPIVATILMRLGVPCPAVAGTVHDLYITCLRHYSPAAFETLAAAADPAITVDFPTTDREEADDKPVIFSRPSPLDRQ